MNKISNGFYMDGDRLVAVTFSGEQAIDMTTGALLEPAPDGLVVAGRHEFDLSGKKILFVGPGGERYGIRWDLGHGEDWCVVGDLP